MLQIFDGVVLDNFDVLFLAPVSLLLKYIYIFFWYANPLHSVDFKGIFVYFLREMFK